HEPDRQRLTGRDDPAGRDQVEGALLTNAAAEHGHHHGRNKAALDLRITEPGTLSRNDDVAATRNAGPAGECASMHHRDDRLGELAYRDQDLAQLQRFALVLVDAAIDRRQQLSQVGTGAEVLPRTANHHHPDLRLQLGAGKLGRDPADHLRRERVALLGTVERDGQDSVSDAAQEVIAHWASFLALSATARLTGISIRSSAVE